MDINELLELMRTRDEAPDFRAADHYYGTKYVYINVPRLEFDSERSCYAWADRWYTKHKR